MYKRSRREMIELLKKRRNIRHLDKRLLEESQRQRQPDEEL
ncbi:MAG TPA: hypothetical protein PLZ84_06505 [Clostridia bacterium]|nr:hypothetical protein [Clostridia bacterium]